MTITINITSLMQNRIDLIKQVYALDEKNAISFAIMETGFKLNIEAQKHDKTAQEIINWNEERKKVIDRIG